MVYLSLQGELSLTYNYREKFLKRFIKILCEKVNIPSLEVNNVSAPPVNNVSAPPVNNVSAPPDEACMLSVTIIMRIFMNFKQYIQYCIFLCK